MTTIPVIHCFDHNYVLPAGVAFRSLLEHANRPGTHYALHVIGSGLTEADRATLAAVVAPFPQASLAFHEPPAVELPAVKAGNFSRDMFFKMALPDLFPQYDVALVSDVDVVYAGDVAPLFDALTADEPFYLAGTPDIGYASWRGEGILRNAPPKFFRRYERLMTAGERARLVLGVGFFAMNLKRCRADAMTSRWFAFAREQAARLVLPEQDVLNLCCAPAVKCVSSRFMAIAGQEGAYRAMSPAERAAQPAWDEMFAHPVQIHFASGVKPWKYPQCPCSRLWFEACLRAGLFDRWRAWYAQFTAASMRTAFGKRLLDIRLPFGRRVFHLQFHKERRP